MYPCEYFPLRKTNCIVQRYGSYRPMCVTRLPPPSTTQFAGYSTCTHQHTPIYDHIISGCLSKGWCSSGKANNGSNESSEVYYIMHDEDLLAFHECSASGQHRTGLVTSNMNRQHVCVIGVVVYTTSDECCECTHTTDRCAGRNR